METENLREQLLTILKRVNEKWSKEEELKPYLNDLKLYKEQAENENLSEKEVKRLLFKTDSLFAEILRIIKNKKSNLTSH